jgi:hypothetical protein
MTVLMYSLSDLRSSSRGGIAAYIYDIPKYRRKAAGEQEVKVVHLGSASSV